MQRKKRRKRIQKPDKPPPDVQAELKQPNDEPPRPHPLGQFVHLVRKLVETDILLTKPYASPETKVAALEVFRASLAGLEPETHRLWELLGRGYRDTYH